MKPWLDRRVRWGIGALAVLFTVAVLSFFTLFKFVEDSERAFRTRYFFEKIDAILGLTLDAEDSVRGYVITGRAGLLNPYKNATYFIYRELDQAAALARPSAVQQENLKNLKTALFQKLVNLKKITELRKTRGLESAQRAVEADHDSGLMKKIKVQVGRIREAQGSAAIFNLQEQKDAARVVLRVGCLQNLLAFFLTLLLTLILFRYISARHRAEEKFREVSQKLQLWVEELEHQNREFTILSETVDTLQSCVTLEEACRVISHSCQKLFPGMGGALYLINEQKSLVELAAEWNGPLEGETVFQFDDCWALRRGRIYEVGKGSDHAPCGHLAGVAFDGYLCIPMMGQGAALGFFHFRYVREAGDAKSSPMSAQLTETKRGLVVAFAEQAALALANLRLREKLHNQSMRDPLTGLFNRRHMEEVLERELRRAERYKKPLGIVMLDIDHFKKFNDTFGHDVGDQLLVELAQHLKRCIRDYDIPCRYGGEEFVILLPEATLEAAHRRAEQIRKSVKHLQIQHDGKLLDPISLSLGVAVFPTHGTTPENLFRVADTALYEAKSAGRDRVVVAEVP